MAKDAAQIGPDEKAAQRAVFIPGDIAETAGRVGAPVTLYICVIVAGKV